MGPDVFREASADDTETIKQELRMPDPLVHRRGFVVACALLLIGCGKGSATHPDVALRAERATALGADGATAYFTQFQVDAAKLENTAAVYAIGRDTSVVDLAPQERWLGAFRGSQFVGKATGVFEVIPGVDGGALFPTTGHIAALVADARAVYWEEDRGLVVVQKGTAPVVLVPRDRLSQDPTLQQEPAQTLALDDDFVYYAENARYIHRVSRADGSVELLLDLQMLFRTATAAPIPQPTALGVYGGGVYVVLNNQNGAASGGLVRIDKASSEAALVWSSSHFPLGLALSGGSAYVTENEPRGEGSGGAVVRVSTDGNDARAVVEGQDRPVDVAVADGTLYFRSAATKEIWSLSVATDGGR